MTRDAANEVPVYFYCKLGKVTKKLSYMFHIFTSTICYQVSWLDESR